MICICETKFSISHEENLNLYLHFAILLIGKVEVILGTVRLCVTPFFSSDRGKKNLGPSAFLLIQIICLCLL